MSHQINNDYICSCLDESFRVMGLTLDEFIPLTVIFIGGLITNNLFIGFILMALVYTGLKSLKKGQGAAILLVLLYIKSDKNLIKSLFKNFPLPYKIWW